MGEVEEIPLSRGMVAKVDASDYQWLMQWKWCVNPKRYSFYAARKIWVHGGKEIEVSMHRLIIDAKPGEYVDHIDGDGLNNTRANLRIANNGQNLWNRSRQKNNTSGYKGVYWHKRAGKWAAQIMANGNYKYLGLHLTIEEAARAYNNAAKELHGEFARLNNV